MIAREDKVAMRLEVNADPYPSLEIVQDRFERFIHQLWAAAIPNARQDGNLQHFNPRFHIRSFSTSGSFQKVDPKTLSVIGRASRRHADFAFPADQGGYSLHMEKFLGDLETLASEVLDTLGFSYGRQTIQDPQKFYDAMLTQSYAKFILSIYLTAQWVRTPKTLELLLKLNPESTSDDLILSILKESSISLFRKRWFWLQSEQRNLWLPPHSFFSYARPIVNLNESESFDDLPTDLAMSPQLVGKKYTSVATSQICLFPISKHVLLYMADLGLEQQIWNRGGIEGDSAAFSQQEQIEKSRGDALVMSYLPEDKETPPWGFPLKINGTRNVDWDIYIEETETLYRVGVQVKLEAIVPLEDVLFNEYNITATEKASFVYIADEDVKAGLEYRSPERFTIDGALRQALDQFMESPEALMQAREAKSKLASGDFSHVLGSTKVPRAKWKEISGEA